MFEIYVKRAQVFFDRPAVMKAMDPARASALAKAGAFIQRTAKRSMRRGGKASPAGKPPKARAGQLRDLLFFGYDRATESVVVGPEAFKRAIAPSLHEFGGTAIVRVGRGRTRRSVRARYEPRPYMRPALAVAIDKGKIPEAFKNSIRA